MKHPTLRLAPTDSDLLMPAGFFPLRLVYQQGDRCVELDRPNMLLGRHSDADLCLPAPEISRRHCRFVFSEGAWEVYDLNSLNGVYVNGERVQQIALHHRDLVAVGAFRWHVELGGEGKQPADESEGATYQRVLGSIAEALPNHTCRES